MRRKYLAIVSWQSNSPIPKFFQLFLTTLILFLDFENPKFHHALLYEDSSSGQPNFVSRLRSRRSKNITELTGSSLVQNISECSRHDLSVSFESIGWSSWIISPKSYNAFYCSGTCLFPLGQEVMMRLLLLCQHFYCSCFTKFLCTFFRWNRQIMQQCKVSSISCNFPLKLTDRAVCPANYYLFPFCIMMTMIM